jgi:hypothetical protein
MIYEVFAAENRRGKKRREKKGKSSFIRVIYEGGESQVEKGRIGAYP